MSISKNARRASAAAIIKKIQGGKPATKSELELLEEVERDTKSACDVLPHTSRVIVDRRIIERFFGVTAQTISKWKQLGMPCESRGAYDIERCFAWWRDTINAGDDDETTTSAKARYWNAKAEEAEINVAKTRGDLISMADVLDQWCRRVSEVRQGLLSLETRLPPLLEGKTLREMRQSIKTEVYALLEGYARQGRYCPVKTKR